MRHLGSPQNGRNWRRFGFGCGVAVWCDCWILGPVQWQIWPNVASGNFLQARACSGQSASKSRHSVSPAGLFRNGSSVIFVKFVALTSHSTTAVAAYTIGNQMERILRRSSLAFGTAATTLCGHSLGAKRTVEADQRGWTTMFVGTLAIVGLGTIIYNAAQPIMRFVHQCGGCDLYRDLLPVCHRNRRTLHVCGNHKRRGTQGGQAIQCPLSTTPLSPNGSYGFLLPTFWPSPLVKTY
ncbi:MAG: hypothetical protein CME25_05045 [Gemmatimonadetes bacterium]|nr:hypothetical protein [Gemmatimonadota bacterium]